MTVIGPDTRFLIGLVARPGTPRRELLGMSDVPCGATSVTFTLRTVESAGRCLQALTSRPAYADALTAAVDAGFNYKSANYSEWQLMAWLRPGDLWAAVVFAREPMPLVAYGAYGDEKLTYIQLRHKNRIVDCSREPAEAIFYQAVLDSVPSFA